MQSVMSSQHDMVNTTEGQLHCHAAVSDLADAIRRQTDAIDALVESNQAMLDYLISLETDDDEEEEELQVMYLDGGMY